MALMFIIQQWRYSLIALLIVMVLLFAAGWHERGNNIKLIQANYNLAIAEMISSHEAESRKKEREIYEKTIEAVNASKKREQIIIADATDARHAVNSLSDTINRLSEAAKLDAEFRDSYSRTTGNLLKECSGEYIKMAETADRIANDLRLINKSSKK